jgi:hypothetical protein
MIKMLHLSSPHVFYWVRVALCFGFLCSVIWIFDCDFALSYFGQCDFLFCVFPVVLWFTVFLSSCILYLHTFLVNWNKNDLSIEMWTLLILQLDMTIKRYKHILIMACWYSKLIILSVAVIYMIYNLYVSRKLNI